MLKYFVSVFLLIALVVFFLQFDKLSYTGQAIIEAVGDEDYGCKVQCLNSYDKCTNLVESAKETCISSLGWWQLILRFGCDNEANDKITVCNSLFNQCSNTC